jgi:hypothetical protein
MASANAARRKYSLEAVLSVRDRCRDVPNGQKVKAAMEEALAELRAAQAQPPPPAPSLVPPAGVQQPDARQRPGNPGLAPAGFGAGPGMARPGPCLPSGRRAAVPMPVSCAPALVLRSACAAAASHAERAQGWAIGVESRRGKAGRALAAVTGAGRRGIAMPRRHPRRRDLAAMPRRHPRRRALAAVTGEARREQALTEAGLTAPTVGCTLVMERSESCHQAAG